MSLFPRKVILTGGNGYVGSELIRQLLAQGVEVHAIANNNSERLTELLPPPPSMPSPATLRPWILWYSNFSRMPSCT